MGNFQEISTLRAPHVFAAIVWRVRGGTHENFPHPLQPCLLPAWSILFRPWYSCVLATENFDAPPASAIYVPFSLTRYRRHLVPSTLVFFFSSCFTDGFHVPPGYTHTHTHTIAPHTQPMGLVLEEDERGNVYIVEIVPGGNASRKKSINVRPG